jgi:hypothetical protein
MIAVRNRSECPGLKRDGPIESPRVSEILTNIGAAVTVAASPAGQPCRGNAGIPPGTGSYAYGCPQGGQAGHCYGVAPITLCRCDELSVTANLYIPGGFLRIDDQQVSSRFVSRLRPLCRSSVIMFQSVRNCPAPETDQGWCCRSRRRLGSQDE